MVRLAAFIRPASRPCADRRCARANTAIGGAGAWLVRRQVAEAVGSSSHLTHRWRGMDSNPWSPVRRENGFRTAAGSPFHARGLTMSAISDVIAAKHSCRVISLIAVGSSGRRSPLPQPVPLTTYVVEHSLGAAEVRGDPRPIAWTIFEDTGSDQLLLDLGRSGASALSAEEVGGCLDYCVHSLVSPREWGRSVDRLLLRSWLTLGRRLTLRSLRSKRRRC